jgi:excinuclease ABC subunit A
LCYLSLGRLAPSLSGGEAQRVRLASQLGAGLIGTIYVLDEPSIGLHAQDHHKLIQALRHLCEIGNTVIVVEHDAEMIRCADYVVDIGPYAGKHGGEILYQGSVEGLLKSKRSITGKYLRQNIARAGPKKTLQPGPRIIGAHHHNLQHIDISIPLGGLICITGVSGSGKSSLITELFYPALANHLHHAQHDVGAHKKIENIDSIDKVIAVDQSPIGKRRDPMPLLIPKYSKLFEIFSHLFRRVACRDFIKVILALMYKKVAALIVMEWDR